MTNCDHCGNYEVKVHFNGEVESKHLCMDCYNRYISDVLEIELEPIIESFSLKDVQGVSRTFNVERQLDTGGIFLKASENIEFGYKFAVHGKLDCNQTWNRKVKI